MLTKNDLSEIGKLIKENINPLEIKTKSIEKDLKDVRKSVKKTEKTVDLMIGLFDNEIVKTQKRVLKIENHLNL